MTALPALLNQNTVCVMFRGTPTQDFLDTFMKKAMSCAKSYGFHVSNDIRTLNPRHSIGYKAFFATAPQDTWVSIECSSLLTGRSDMSAVEHRLSEQAQSWFGSSDVTVFIVDTASPKGRDVAEDIARLLGGIIIDGWQTETYGVRTMRTFQNCETALPDCLDVLVMPQGWSRLDAIALVDYVASTLPAPLDFKLTCDEKANKVVMRSASLSAERITVNGDTSVTLSAYEREAGRILSKVAAISGGQYAACLSSDPCFVDVTDMGADTLPSLTEWRFKALRQIMQPPALSTIMSASDRKVVSDMISDVAHDLYRYDLKSQKASQ